MSAAPDQSISSHVPPVSNGSYPVRGGNLVRPLIDGETAFTRICEAVEAAEHSVWVTVAFLDEDFEMPGGRGSVFDVLDAAAARGLDVRVIFWRTHLETARHFHGHAGDHDFLNARGSKFRARWDRAQRRYCQHQKSWLIDAGRPVETAFVGGINLNPESVTAAGHANRDGPHTHDVYCELRGPSASDVHHNFVQRWNEASEREIEGGVWPPGSRGDTLTFPVAPSPAAGDTTVQMQRSVRAGHYSDGAAAPGADPFDIAGGERSIFEQYVAAIDAARQTIYIEDQYIASPDVVAHLDRALARGVDVVFLCPAEPEAQVRAARRNPAAESFFDALAALGRFDNFLLAGIAAPQSDGALKPIYIHDKIMLVDDHWATIGSCNIASQSFFCDTELNVAIWDASVVRSLRRALLMEHLAEDTMAMSDGEALARFRTVARANARRFANGEALQGLAFALDPAEYAR